MKHAGILLLLLILILTNTSCGKEVNSSVLENNSMTSSLDSPSTEGISSEDNSSEIETDSNLKILLYSQKKELAETIKEAIIDIDNEMEHVATQDKPWIYVSFADITGDDIPEYFIGGCDTKAYIYYDTYSSTNIGRIIKTHLDTFENRFAPCMFEGKKYISNDGIAYFISKADTGTAVDIGYRITKIWNEDQEWKTEVTDLWMEEYVSTDSYEPLANATVIIEPDERDNIDEKVEECINQYLESCKEVGIDLNAEYEFPEAVK